MDGNQSLHKTLHPDFPFDYLRWIESPAGVARLPDAAQDASVAIVGAGLAGLVAAFELCKIGFRPIVYESGWIGGRLRSHQFDGVDSDVVAELGGMRFPATATLFWHYAQNLLGLERKPFPNPTSPAAGCTTIELLGKRYHGNNLGDFPIIFQDIMTAWMSSLERDGKWKKLKAAWSADDVRLVKDVWNDLVRHWDDRSFYDFLCNSQDFKNLPYEYKEVFGQIGFGTGGWDSDFQNTMLEIFRVVFSGFDSDQYLIVGGAQQVPLGLWSTPCAVDGSSIKDRNHGSPHGKVKKIYRNPDTKKLVVENEWGISEEYSAVLVTCQSWLLTTSIDVEETLFSDRLWMALDRTRYMQSSKTFVLVDRPFWKAENGELGSSLAVTLSDRLTRGTYLFDSGPNKPAVICLTYSWMGDALKVLPLSIEQRTQLSLSALKKMHPNVCIERHIKSRPVSISWELEENFLGAFKGALPGHYRYNRIMYTHFWQEELPKEEQGIFLAGDDVSWTPGWAEGAIHTALNAVWGIIRHFGGRCSEENPGPGDVLNNIGPIHL